MSEMKLSVHVRRVIPDPILAEDVAEDIEELEGHIEALIGGIQDVRATLIEQRHIYYEREALDNLAALAAHRPEVLSEEEKP